MVNTSIDFNMVEFLLLPKWMEFGEMGQYVFDGY